MATTTTTTNKPLIPRAKDYSPSPIGYNRGALYSGKALDFDGVNDQVNVTTSDLDFGANDFSVTVIANWTGANTDGKLAFAERGATPSSLASWQIRTDGVGNMKFQTNTAGGGWTEVSFSGVEAILNSGLTHLTFVRVGSSVTLYINGALYGSGSGIASTLDATNGNFCIGNRIGSANYWNGLIGQYKIFNTALTAAQVADLYLNPEKIVPDGVADSALKLWLPMMEGAGTTAYDGSGNGNHGTISGATWVSGIGAPVAQTALVSWNKGTNLLKYSEEFDESSGWSPTAASVTADDTTAPDGQNTADKLVPSATNANHYLTSAFCTIASGAVLVSVFAKKGNTDFLRIRLSGTTQNVRAWFDLENGIVGTIDAGGTATITDVGNGWYKCTAIESGNTTATSSFQAQLFIQESDGQTTWDADGDEYIYIWGASLEQSATAGPYVRTGATAQTSLVLLPQGLTANKDITGVNAFESARNPYALNLDGASWAEVHDNASLDMTSAITLEAWVYWDGTATDDGIVGRWGSVSADQNYMLYAQTTNNARFYINNSFIAATISNGWNHFIGTYDKTTMKFYVNGSLKNSTANTADITTSDKPIEIGRYFHGATAGIRLYPNDIALPRIYNRALTATEVARNYNADKSKFGL